MSTRSDVGIALKTGIFKKLSMGSKEILNKSFVPHESDEGIFFHASYIAWCPDEQAVYAELAKFDDGDYLVVEACHDYPESTEGDAGNWTENPWGAQREISVRVEFTPSEEL